MLVPVREVTPTTDDNGNPVYRDAHTVFVNPDLISGIRPVSFDSRGQAYIFKIYIDGTMFCYVSDEGLTILKSAANRTEAQIRSDAFDLGFKAGRELFLVEKPRSSDESEE